jgi:hypothetical protein
MGRRRHRDEVVELAQRGLPSAASVVMLLVMATPPGRELFVWYVG